MTNIEQEMWTITFGVKTANTIPYRWVATEFQNQRGSVWCQTCRKEGSFEGVFYASCPTCCSEKGYCSCVYCHVAKKDGHQHLMKRANIFKFVKELQTVIADLKRDYPEDDYGIVKEGIEAGFYILNLHTAKQYELMLLDMCMPFEVSQLSNEDLTYRWNPEREVPETVIRSALKAAKRLGIAQWVQELWSGTKYESSHVAEEKEKEDGGKNGACFTATGACFTATGGAEPPVDIIACYGCAAMMTSDERGDLCHTCLEAYLQDTADYDVQCKECDTWIAMKEVDKRGYCLDCQNPEYDPVWPMGD